MSLKHGKEGGEYLTLDWSHLSQSLPSVWALGILGRRSIQDVTLTPCSPSPHCFRDLFHPLLCKLSLLHPTATPTSQEPGF